MKMFEMPALSKNQKHAIPYEERLEAYAAIVLHGMDADEVVSELYTKHGLKVPKHGKQAFGAFSRMVKRKMTEQDPATLELMEKYGFKEEAAAAGSSQGSATVPSTQLQTK